MRGTNTRKTQASHPSRREFLRRALLAGTALPLAGATILPLAGTTGATTSPAPGKTLPPAERLQIGVIGPRGRGADNARGVSSEDIVALSDIDATRLAEASKEYPGAQTFKDFRRLLDVKGLDAVVVSTPDHMHAIPAVEAMRRGLDVYCEKPLAHSVHEVRVMRETAKRFGRVTQMGTQIHAEDNYRRVVEIVRAGVLGKIRRVHVWMGGKPRVGKRVAQGTPPAHVDYDLWIGPAPFRPFHASHFHFNWRYWWDFGGGVLADFGCHYMDLPHWALDLRAPLRVEARGEKTYKGHNDVPDNLRVDYHYPAREYPARGALPPVHLTWYHGDWRPEGAEVYGKGSAVLFEGENGRLLADYGSRKLFLDDEHKDAKLPEKSIPDSAGHHREWIDAVKTRGTTTCNFDTSGALAETVLLGNVSYRCGKKLEWDDRALEATGTPEARQYIRREYRKGWTLWQPTEKA
ncbi:MAG: Gfo/Idh/MocA family oxidoreductase [Planctomycetota bacterium]|nr:Gfo/Idh/MocA family oxidoreductase [Planctomycetota bacterium]